MPATATDIPIELYDLILSFFTTQVFLMSEDERNHVKVDKWELGSVSLVCRDWALACRPKIFASVTLRDREDLGMLLRLIMHPTSRIAGYISDVRCTQSLSSPGTPWIHTVCLQLLPRLPSSPSILVSLHGPLRPGQGVTSVFDSYPRRFPSNVFNVRRLYLGDVHFGQFRDLMRLVGEIPSLSTLYCWKVTWDSPPGGHLPVPIPFISRNSGDCEYYLTESTDNVAGAWFHWLIPPSKTCRMREEDAHALYHITSALVKNIAAGKSAKHIVKSLRKGNSLGFEYPLSSIPAARMHLMSASTSEWISSLEIDFSPALGPSISETIAQSDWTTIDEHLEALRDLDKVSLRFIVFDDLLRFARDVVALKMPHLNSSTKLTYEVWNGRRGLDKQWTPYTPETIQLKLAKEAEKRSKEPQAVEETDGFSAEPGATGIAAEDAEDNDVVASAVEAQAD